MTAFALGLATALVALRCELIRDDPYTLGAVSRVLPSTRPAFLRALNQTRRLIGCPTDGDVEEPNAGFTGGQCPGPYIVTGTYTLGCGASAGETRNWTTSGPINGPISGVFAGGDNVWRVQGGTTTAPIFGTGGGLSLINAPRPGTACNQLPVPARAAQNVAITAASPQGFVDDCGSLDGPYPPPINITNDIDVTYIDDGTEVTVNVPVTFMPITVNFDGTLRVPINVNLGGFEFSGDLNLPDFNLTINKPALPPGSGEDLSGQGEDGPGETTPPAPPGEKIIGIVVTATQIDQRRVSSYSSPGIPPIFVPRLGSIKFVYSIGTATFFSSDIDIKDRRTFIPCPFSQGADAVIASPNLGVDLSFVPIKGFPLATTNDIQPAA